MALFDSDQTQLIQNLSKKHNFSNVLLYIFITKDNDIKAHSKKTHSIDYDNNYRGLKIIFI